MIGLLEGIFRSLDMGANWGAMPVPPDAPMLGFSSLSWGHFVETLPAD